MSRKPKMSVADVRAIARAGLLWRVARRLFSPAAMARHYNASRSVIQFIQNGGQYGTYARLYDDSESDPADQEKGGAPVIRAFEDGFIAEIAEDAAGRQRLIEAICRSMEVEVAFGLHPHLLLTAKALADYMKEYTPCRPPVPSSESPS